ncbi:MAG: M23 family metallopeptidase [Candidatus Dormibacteria bacterium]
MTGAQLLALGVVTDPVLAAQITSIVQQPATVERPSLHHFALASTHAVVAPAVRPPAGRFDLRFIFNGLAAVLAMVVFLATLPVDWSRRRRRRSEMRRRGRVVMPKRTRLLAFGVSIFAASGMVGTGMVATGSVFNAAMASLPPVASGPSGVLSPGHRLVSQVERLTRSGTWIHLAAMEHSLVVRHDELVRQEAEVAFVTQVLQQEALVGAPDPEATANLQQLVASYQTAAAAYQESLQQEYQYYVAAVQSPTQRASLLAATASAPAEARDAVNANLDAVEAQVSQEAAISAAEAQQAALPTAAGAVVAPAPPTVATAVTGQAVVHPDTAAPQPAAAKAPAGATAPQTLTSPLGGEISQGFGPSPYSFEPPVSRDGQFYPHFHTGLDITAPLDTPVHAAAGGTVILATSSVNAQGFLVGYGNYVAISHGGGLTTVYGHLDRLLVKAGQKVSQGDIIGLEGSTGNSTGPHLHFETRLQDAWVDPTRYLAAAIRR